MASGKITVEIRIKNPDAFNGLIRTGEMLRQLIADYPWIDELREAREELTKAVGDLEVAIDDDHPDVATRGR